MAKYTEKVGATGKKYTVYDNHIKVTYRDGSERIVRPTDASYNVTKEAMEKDIADRNFLGIGNKKSNINAANALGNGLTDGLVSMAGEPAVDTAIAKENAIADRTKSMANLEQQVAINRALKAVQTQNQPVQNVVAPVQPVQPVPQVQPNKVSNVDVAKHSVGTGVTGAVGNLKQFLESMLRLSYEDADAYRLARTGNEALTKAMSNPEQTDALADYWAEQRLKTAQETAEKQQALNEKYNAENFNKAQQLVGGAGSSLIQIAPAMLMGGPLGTGYIMAQGFGAGSNQALAEGATQEQADDFGLAESGKEIVINKLINTMPNIGGIFNPSKLTGKIANPTLRTGADIAARTAGEGVEESLSTFIDPYLQRAIYKPDAENATMQEIIDSAIMGMIAGGAANIGAKIAQPTQNIANQQENMQEKAQNQTDTAQSAQNNPEQAQDIPMTENPRNMENMAQNQSSQAVFEQKPVENIQNQKPVENTPKKTLEMAERTFENVKNSKVKAYQQENPEIKPYQQDVASRLLHDLMMGEKGRREVGIDPETRNVTTMQGIKRNQSEPINRMLDDGLNYKQIEDGLNRIVEDHGKENTTTAKRVELYVHDAMRDGYNSIVDGRVDTNNNYAISKMNMEELEAEAQRLTESLSSVTDEEQFAQIESQLDTIDKRMEHLRNEATTSETETVAEESSKADSEPSEQSKRKVSQFYTNTMQKTPLFTEAERNLFEASEYEYDVVSEKESIRKATERLEADYEGTKRELQEKEMLTGDDVDAAMFFVQEGLNIGRETGDYSQAKAWTKKIQESATVEGRAVQALAKYSRTTAEGLMVQAQKYVKQSEDALKTDRVLGKEKDSAKWRKIEAETEQATKAIEEAETKAAESANAELKKRVREYKTKHYRTNPNPTAKPEPDFGDKLYKKVLEGANLELEEKGALTGKQIVDELYQKLKENGMPDYRGHRGKRNYTSLEYLKDAVQHKAEYAEVFAKTQEYMKAEYGNDPEVLQLINEALNGNFSTLKLDTLYSRKTVEKAVKETADLFGIDLKEIIKQSQGKKDEAAQVIKNHIMQYTDVPDADAAQLANDVVDVYCGELKRLTEERLNQLFPKEVKQQKKRKRTAFDDLLELINLGAYDRQDIVDAIKQKNNLPVLTNADIKIIQENVEAANQYERYSYEWKKHMAKAQQVAADKMPQATKNKITQLKRLMMLSNPRTDVRNVTGNVPLAGTEIMSDVIGSFVDKRLSKARGTDRTTTANPHLVEFMKGFGAGVKDTVKDIRNDVNTYRMDEEATTQYELPKGRTFQNTTGGIRGGINDFLNGMDKIVNYGLMFGDRPFFEAHYAKRMAQLKDLGYDVEAKETKADAYAYAVDMVFQSDSNMAQGARNLREGLNNLCTINGFALGDFVLPFVQTPANIADKLLDYSPVGFVRAMGQVKNSKTEAFDQRLFCQRVGRAFTGAAILGIAHALAEEGIITGGSDDNAEKRNAMTAAGWKPYSFYIDGKYYDYSYIQPVGMLLAMVADAYQEGQSAEDLSDWIEIASAGIKGGADCFFNMSFFASLTDFFGGYGTTAENIGGAILDFPTQFAPAIVNAANKSIDPYQRETYDSDPIKRTINKFIAKTPASQTLPKKLDVYGNEMMQNQGRSVVQRTIENMLFPSTVSEKVSDTLNDELLRLNKYTGSKAQFLSYPDKKQDLGSAGEYKLSGEEYTKFIKDANGYAAEQMTKFVKSSAYQSLDDATRVDILNEIEKYASYRAKQKLAESHNKKYSNSNYKAIEESGIEPYRYYATKKQLGTLKGDDKQEKYQSYLKREIKAGNMTEEEAWYWWTANYNAEKYMAKCPYSWIREANK